MTEMEEKLGSVLSNPQMMQQIMAMAQSLGQSSSTQEETVKQPDPPKIDPALVQALHPYLSRNRVIKLEKAMRAAKMARLASGFLNQGGLSLLTGR